MINRYTMHHVQYQWACLTASEHVVHISSVNQMIRHDTISILIPSDTIFADILKIIRYRSMSIDIMILYTNLMILYTYLNAILTKKCNQNI